VLVVVLVQRLLVGDAVGSDDRRVADVDDLVLRDVQPYAGARQPTSPITRTAVGSIGMRRPLGFGPLRNPIISILTRR